MEQAVNKNRRCGMKGFDIMVLVSAVLMGAVIFSTLVWSNRKKT